MKILFRLFYLTFPLVLLVACGDASGERASKTIVAEGPALIMFYTDN